MGPDGLPAPAPDPREAGPPRSAALTDFGHALETFAVGEILKEASWTDDIVGAGQWRTRDDEEVDLVLESDDGGVIGFEIKAASRVSGADLAGLRKLRGTLGKSFFAGVALYTGARTYSSDDRPHVMPIDRLWTT